MLDKRCIVISDGYFEWKKNGSKKQPFYIRLPKGELLLMAGLYDIWKGADSELFTFSVITMNASPEIQHIHDRMPVILNNDQAKIWLHCESNNVETAMNVIKSITSIKKEEKKSINYFLGYFLYLFFKVSWNFLKFHKQ